MYCTVLYIDGKTCEKKKSLHNSSSLAPHYWEIDKVVAELMRKEADTLSASISGAKSLSSSFSLVSGERFGQPNSSRNTWPLRACSIAFKAMIVTCIPGHIMSQLLPTSNCPWSLVYVIRMPYRPFIFLYCNLYTARTQRERLQYVVFSQVWHLLWTLTVCNFNYNTGPDGVVMLESCIGDLAW